MAHPLDPQDSKPVIIHILDTVTYAGVEKYLLELLPYLVKEYEIHLILVKGDGPLLEEYEKWVKIHRLELSSSIIKPKNLLKIFQLRQKLKKRKPVLIQAWSFDGNAVATILSKTLNCPFILTRMGSNQKWSRLRKFREQVSCQLAKSILVNTRVLISEFPANVHGKINVIQNPLHIPNEEKLKNIDPLLVEIKNRGGIIVGSLGRIVMEKRYEDFLEVAIRLTNKYEDIHFIAVGAKGYYEKMRVQAEASPNPSRIKFVGRVDDAMAFLNGFDIFVNCSRQEGLPYGVMEAMACGKPIVATDVGGTGEVVSDKTNGFLVPRLCPDELEARLEELYLDSEIRIRMGHESREISHRFSAERIYEDFWQMYQKCLNLKKSSKHSKAGFEGV